MKTLTEGGRSKLAPLFASHRRLPMVIEAMLEGQFGTALVDSEKEPRLALLGVTGKFYVLGGGAEHPLAPRMTGVGRRWREALVPYDVFARVRSRTLALPRLVAAPPDPHIA